MDLQAAVIVVHRWRTSVAPQRRPLSQPLETDVVHFSTGRSAGDIGLLGSVRCHDTTMQPQLSRYWEH
jgi:hypothetical protein